MHPRSEQEKAAEQERRRKLALALNEAMQEALDDKGPVPAATVRHMLATLESLTQKVCDE